MTIVVDASTAPAGLPPDEGSDATDRALDHVEASHGSVPSIVRREVRDILLLSERRKRITGAMLDASLLRPAKLPVQDTGPGDDAAVIRLARARAPTARDAASSALTLTTGAPLAPLDRALAAAARSRGVALTGPLAP